MIISFSDRVLQAMAGGRAPLLETVRSELGALDAPPGLRCEVDTTVFVAARFPVRVSWTLHYGLAKSSRSIAVRHYRQTPRAAIRSGIRAALRVVKRATFHGLHGSPEQLHVWADQIEEISRGSQGFDAGGWEKLVSLLHHVAATGEGKRMLLMVATVPAPDSGPATEETSALRAARMALFASKEYVAFRHALVHATAERDE